MSNSLFQNALRCVPQNVPPVWMMRQAGRYHRHYQALKAQHSFMELCKDPALAAEVALGPINDFDFDVSILFSDLLFPLEALGMGLRYEGTGPELDWHFQTESDLQRLIPAAEAVGALEFQREAVRLTRAALPKNKSLIGFVGGPWTLFAYACQGAHDGSLIEAKKRLPLFDAFCRILVPLLVANIRLQLEGGAELVMVFDTAAGELSPSLYQRLVVPQLERLAAEHPGRLGYYSRGTQSAHLEHSFFQGTSLAGLGVDHRWPLPPLLAARQHGFVQGNFDQALLFADTADFERELQRYLRPFLELSTEARAGWVCGLGHGVLPKTPEDHVRRFVGVIRETFGK